MVDIDEYLRETLSTSEDDDEFSFQDSSLPVFGYVPDFGEDEPEEYIIYTYYDTPNNYADNEEHALEYTVSINIFTQSPNPSLERAVKAQMASREFIYQGSTSRDITTYPDKLRKIQEYKILFTQEETICQEMTQQELLSVLKSL